MTNKPIICLDFDGVIHSYKSGWQGPRNIPDPPVQGAIAFIMLIIWYYPDYQISIHSSRFRYFRAKRAVKKWLVKWGLPKKGLKLIKFSTRKPAYKILIDDRCMRFTGAFPPIDYILDFKSWVEKKNENTKKI